MIESKRGGERDREEDREREGYREGGTGRERKWEGFPFSLTHVPSILSFKTINMLNLSFECNIPRPQNAETPLLALS
jgi:hypothetical protein